MKEIVKAIFTGTIAVITAVATIYLFYDLGVKHTVESYEGRITVAEERVRAQVTDELTRYYEGQAVKDELIARLVVSLSDPAERARLPKSAREALDAAATVVTVGDLQSVPGNSNTSYKAVPKNDCVPLGVDIKAKRGMQFGLCGLNYEVFVVGGSEASVRFIVDGSVDSVVEKGRKAKLIGECSVYYREWTGVHIVRFNC